MLPADGKPHVLTATIGAGGHADYPLRISGLSLQFATPTHLRAPEHPVGLARAGAGDGR